MINPVSCLGAPLLMDGVVSDRVMFGSCVRAYLFGSSANISTPSTILVEALLGRSF